MNILKAEGFKSGKGHISDQTTLKFDICSPVIFFLRIVFYYKFYLDICASYFVEMASNYNFWNNFFVIKKNLTLIPSHSPKSNFFVTIYFLFVNFSKFYGTFIHLTYERYGTWGKIFCNDMLVNFKEWTLKKTFLSYDFINESYELRSDRHSTFRISTEKLV